MQAPNRRVLHLHGRDGTRVHSDGIALGDLEPRAPGSADPNGDWRALYEQWLLKRNLLQAAVDLGAQLLKQELGRYLGPGATVLKALAPGLRDTRTLRQNATRWVHRAIDLIEDAQGSASPLPHPPQPPPAPPISASSPADPPRTPGLQRWLERQDHDHE